MMRAAEEYKRYNDIHIRNMDGLKMLRGFPDGMFDAMITDPPYAMGATLSAKAAGTSTKYSSNKRCNPYPDFDGDSMDQRSWTFMMSDVLREAKRVCRSGAVCAIFIDWRQLPSLTDAMQRAGWIWRGVAVWDKVNARPQRGRFTQQAEFIVWGSNGRLPIDRPVPVLPGVFSVFGGNIPDRIHQTQKPLELMRQIVKICVPGGAILDPFAGSGTTLLAARMEGYSAFGADSNPAIAKAAAERLRITME